VRLAYKSFRLSRLLAISLVRQRGTLRNSLRSVPASLSLAHCAPFHAALPYALRDFMPVFVGVVG